MVMIMGDCEKGHDKRFFWEAFCLLCQNKRLLSENAALESQLSQATVQREEWEKQSRHHELEAERYEKALKRILEPFSAEQPHHIARRALDAVNKGSE